MSIVTTQEQHIPEAVEQTERMIEEVKAIELPFDFKRTDRLWEPEYGITTVPLLVRDTNGKLYDDHKFKGVFVDGKYHRLVSRQYVVFPNQEVDKIVQDALTQYPDLHLQRTHKSHRGDAMYWEIISDKFNAHIPYSFETDDEIQIGCIVRNSLGTGIALGADLFTYRLRCLNGAVARGRDLASLAIKHAYKEPEVMREQLSRRLYDIIQEASYLTDTYIRATKLKFTEKLANDLYKRIPDKYLPDYIIIDKDTPIKHGLHTIRLRAGTNISAWEGFNDITRAIWHSEKAGFLYTSNMTQYAHSCLLQAVKKGGAQ